MKELCWLAGDSNSRMGTNTLLTLPCDIQKHSRAALLFQVHMTRKSQVRLTLVPTQVLLATVCTATSSHCKAGALCERSAHCPTSTGILLYFPTCILLHRTQTSTTPAAGRAHAGAQPHRLPRTRTSQHREGTSRVFLPHKLSQLDL